MSGLFVPLADYLWALSCDVIYGAHACSTIIIAQLRPDILGAVITTSGITAHNDLMYNFCTMYGTTFLKEWSIFFNANANFRERRISIKN